MVSPKSRTPTPTLPRKRGREHQLHPFFECGAVILPMRGALDDYARRFEEPGR
jgi:hypothetical protein